MTSCAPFRSSFLLLQLLCCLVSRTFALNFSGFEPLPDAPQDFGIIEFGLPCPTPEENDEFVARITDIQWTVEPVATKESVVISTKPPGLVNVAVQNGILRFEYNTVSLSIHPNGAGVLIQVPQDQLEAIHGAPGLSFTAHVLQGFTRLESVVQDGNSAFLFVFVNNTTTNNTLAFSDHGRSNSILMGGTNLKVKNALISATSSVVTIDGILESGILSGSNVRVFAEETIQHLTITGTRNRIWTNDLSTGCSNVEFQSEPNDCDVHYADAPVPPTVTVSTRVFLLTCSSSSENDLDEPSTTASAAVAWKPMARNAMSTVTLFAAWIWQGLA